MRHFSSVFTLLFFSPAFGLLSSAALAQSSPALPVREVTIFKDGHAFLLQQGKVRVGGDGVAVLPNLPNPILGTFWPYATERGVTLQSVTGRLGLADIERSAVTSADYLRANIGSLVEIRRGVGANTEQINGIVVSVLPDPPLPDLSEPLPAPPPNPNARPGYYGGGFGGPAITATQDNPTALIKVDGSLIPVPVAQITSLTLRGDAHTKVMEKQPRAELSLLLSGANGKETEVGFMYLQRGMRWIPNYKVTLDGKGSAQVAFQGTIINDMTDFNNALVNLVVGVPTFLFKDQPDPIGMQDVFARLSRYFSDDSGQAQNFSNAIMGQAGGGFGGAGFGYGIGPDLSQPPSNAPEGNPLVEKNEDLFLFPVRNVSLKKGQRMTLPVASFTVPYEDVYALELLPGPTRTNNNYNPQNSRELARLYAAPKVERRVRLRNRSVYPLTTAPALVLNGKQVVAQTMMRYAPTNAVSDLPVTVGVNAVANREDREVKRTPNAAVIRGDRHSLIEVEGVVTVTNFDDKPLPLEVTRYVFGTVTGAGDGGTVTALDFATEIDNLLPESVRGYYYLADYNGIGRIFWKQTVPPGKTVKLTYTWKYLRQE